MNVYTEFDYLCNEPFYIEDIGTIKCPTLREIRKTTYNIFSLYLNIASISFEDYLKSINILEKYNALSDEDKRNNTMFNILLSSEPNIIIGMLKVFLLEDFEFDQSSISFTTFEIVDGEKQIVGHIGNDNFDQFRTRLQLILGIKKDDEKEIRFKNKTARKLFEKLKKNKEKQKKKQDENYTLDNMIKKYCTHNKVGINILNVWDMTYYQFMSMFTEYCNGRQCDFNDMMAANTFSYKKSTDYKPLEYMKNLNNN